mmetsp:Transcript_52361/g.131543  ORF Transcript_52361/g.131543 Transcript_52361/m.131543 type:complete len:254 (+) Transcript_52361:227-988(+)
MAANFWTSTHCKKWLLTQDDLNKAVQKQLGVLNQRQFRFLNIYFVHAIQRVGKHLHMRQRAIATAVVYFKRFYTKYTFKESDPRLLVPTCLYLSSKVEELTVSMPALLHLMKLHVDSSCTFTEDQIVRCEFSLLRALKYSLVVFHPYRPLVQFVSDSGFGELLEPAWALVNDSYCSDICLLHPPFKAAIACLYLAGFIHNNQRGLMQWLSEIAVDLTDIQDIVTDLVKLYSLWEGTTQEEINQALKLVVPVNT